MPSGDHAGKRCGPAVNCTSFTLVGSRRKMPADSPSELSLAKTITCSVGDHAGSVSPSLPKMTGVGLRSAKATWWTLRVPSGISDV